MKRLLSGWQDSNLRPPAPKAGAITGLRYTPKMYFVILPESGCKDRNKFDLEKEKMKINKTYFRIAISDLF